MLIHKVIYRSGLIVLLAISVMFYPLATGIHYQRSHAYAQEPFQTLPPANATFETPIGLSTPMPTPMPTVQPGQYFEEGSLGLPDVFIEKGDAQFGYGSVVGNEELYAVWVTDENGTHYLIVDKDSEILWNERDPASGFVNLIREREKKFNEILIAKENLEI